MDYRLPIIIWVYLVATTIGEVLIFYRAPGTFYVDIAIGTIAMVNSAVAALYLMDLRKEPPAVQYLMLSPLVLAMVLIMTLVFALA